MSGQVEQRTLALSPLLHPLSCKHHSCFEHLFDQAPNVSLSAEQEQQEIMLNVAAMVDLTHRFLPAMLTRHGGSIINVASTAAFQPIPYIAVYGASKAFVLSFSEALWADEE